ncbi:MAG TPA: alpha/beta fold hydrolase [Streptosporangiaceae bacterium]|jgi:hypothetical protein
MRSLRTAMVLATVVATVSLAACSSGGDTPSGDSTSSGSGTVAAKSTDASFVVDGTTTYGTLEIPAHRSGQRLAAALLIPGSGPTDRNGNQVSSGTTPDTLGLIATILARQGIMTYRFDKYFTGQTGGGKFAGDPAALTVGDYLSQADAAYKFLASQPQVNPAKMLIVGHSEGGMFALSVADSASDKPAGLALLEPQDLRILTLFEVQADETINALAAQGTLTDPQARANGRLVQQAISQFRAGQPVSTKGMAPAIVQFVTPEILTPSVTRFVHGNDLISPAALAAKVKSGTQVLVTDGTKDTKVPPGTIGPLVQALKGAGITGPGLTMLQGTDHDMHLLSQPDTSPVLAPAAISAIQHWAQPFAAGS